MKKIDRIWLILLSAVLGSGLALHAQPRAGQTSNLKSDIVYKTTAQGDLYLDLYYPDSGQSGPHPLVVYTHGGGWAAGNKNLGGMGPVVRGLTDKGFAVVSVNYRLCKSGGTICMKDCVIDCKDAVRYLAKNHVELNLDTDQVFTFGDSAGGHLCQMLLLSSPQSFPGAKELADYSFKMIAGVSWYGPCDFEKTDLFTRNAHRNIMAEEQPTATVCITFRMSTLSTSLRSCPRRCHQGLIPSGGASCWIRNVIAPKANDQ